MIEGRNDRRNEAREERSQEIGQKEEGPAEGRRTDMTEYEGRGKERKKGILSNVYLQ